MTPAYVAYGRAYEHPGDERYYVAAWDDTGPASEETLHDTAAAAYLAARRLAGRLALDVYACDDFGPMAGGLVAVLGQSGWAIRHTVADWYVTDAQPTQAAAWAAIGGRTDA